MEAKNILDVEKFVVASNDMLTGKFLDLNKRLEKFLSVMTKSEDILDLLSECIENFDEEVEFTKAFSLDKNGEPIIDIPTDDHKRLALSVTIFNNIANKKLNATQFLDTYFQTPNSTRQNQSFLPQDADKFHSKRLLHLLLNFLQFV